MRATHLLTAALLLGTAACSVVTTATAPRDQNAEVRLERGLQALDAGEYRAAFDELAWVYARCAGHERGLHALVGLAAVELDPRNRSGRPGVGSDLLGRLLTTPGTPSWLLPMGETSYLMALALGAPEASITAPDTSGEPVGEPEDAAADAPADTTAEEVQTEEEVQRARARTVLDPATYQLTDEPAYGCGRAVTVEDDRLARVPPTLPGPSLLSLLADMEASRDSASVRARALNAELEALRQRLAETEQELERIRRTLRP